MRKSYFRGRGVTGECTRRVVNSRKYSAYGVDWLRFLLVFGLLPFVFIPTKAIFFLQIAFLARSQQYGAVEI